MVKTAASRQPDVAPMRQRLVNARLLNLLKLTRISAELTYRRHVGLTEMHRRLITLIGTFNGLSSAGLVRLTGSDKAQISRAVKALDGSAMISRAGLRGNIQLTPAGSAAFERIMTVARERDEAITRGIGKAELKRFATTTSQLTHRAELLLSLERQLSGEANGAETTDSALDGFPTIAEQLGEDGSRPHSRLTIPTLLTLVSYLQRSGTVAYKRETGISQFEWQILSQVAEHGPITLAELIALTARDKSHIGRTLKRLAEAGLVSQQRVAGRRETVLAPTAEGQRVYDQMCTIAIRRDDFVFADLPAGTKAGYVSTIDKLTANAEAMLLDERARS